MNKQEEHKQGVTKAVIYCRVSSTKQKTEGGGLDSQEHRCRQYAELKGYQVDAVFPDDASGGGDFINRPGMVALLSYLDAQPDKEYVVIFDDLKRFARDTEFHIKLRREFQTRGARIECLNFKHDDTPEGKFVETIFAPKASRSVRPGVTLAATVDLQRRFGLRNLEPGTETTMTDDRMALIELVETEPEPKIGPGDRFPGEGGWRSRPRDVGLRS